MSEEPEQINILRAKNKQLNEARAERDRYKKALEEILNTADKIVDMQTWSACDAGQMWKIAEQVLKGDKE